MFSLSILQNISSSITSLSKRLLFTEGFNGHVQEKLTLTTCSPSGGENEHFLKVTCLCLQFWGNLLIECNAEKVTEWNIRQRVRGKCGWISFRDNLEKQDQKGKSMEISGWRTWLSPQSTAFKDDTRIRVQAPIPHLREFGFMSCATGLQVLL